VNLSRLISDYLINQLLSINRLIFAALIPRFCGGTGGGGAGPEEETGWVHLEKRPLSGNGSSSLVNGYACHDDVCACVCVCVSNCT